MTDHADRDDRSAPGLSARESALTYRIDDGEPPSEAVVRAIASLTNTPVLDLEPLYEVVDPNHLDGVLGSDAPGVEEATVTIAFGGCRVTVTRDEVRVQVRTPEAD